MRYGIVLAVVVLLFGAHALRAEDALTLNQALRMAYLNNPALNSGRSQLLAAHEALPQADAGWKPSLTADASITNTEDATTKVAGLGLAQPVYRGGRTMAQTGSARHAIAARAEILRTQEQDLFEAAASSYMDVLRDEALLSLRQQNRDIQARQLKATRDRFEVGELTKTDVSQSEARLAGAEADMLNAQGNVNSSRAVFEKIIGTQPINLAVPDSALVLPASLDEALQKTEEGSPVIQAAVHLRESSEKDVDTIFGELLPEVNLVAGIDRTQDPPTGGGDDTDSTIGIQASMPLYEAGAVRSRVRQAKHTANSRSLDVMEARRSAREDTVRAWSVLQAARAQIVSRAAQVEAASLARQGVKQEAEIGSRSVLDVLDADQELLDAQVALTTARRDEIVAQFSLLAALGGLTPEVLGFGGEAVDTGKNLAKVRKKIFDMNVDRLEQTE